MFRGFMGREKANSHLAVQLDGRQLSLFHYYSIQIQKCVRGFYSRKYKHDHERRKRFRKRIADDGERVRQQMEDYSIKQKMVTISHRNILKSYHIERRFFNTNVWVLILMVLSLCDLSLVHNSMRRIKHRLRKKKLSETWPVISII